MAEHAIRIIAHGRVQGVGFRFFVRQNAVAIGVTGWVKNCADGSVELHAEGSREQLELLVERVRQGPTFGHVSDLEVDWRTASNDFQTFDITF